MNTILVPTDFSKNALNAVKYAFAYSEEIKSRVILFHSYNNPTGEIKMPFSDICYSKQEARQNAEVRMKKLLTTLSKAFPNAKPKWIVQPGIASNNIAEYVKQNNIGLVIMGTTGQGAITRVLIGSTTSSVIADAPCTIIAVPPKAKFKGINKVAIATDLEKDGLLAIDELVHFGKQFHAEITFIHVQDIEFFDVEDTLLRMVNSIKERMKYKKISFYICKGSDIANGLNFFIKKQKPDILSMVKHNRKFYEKIWKTSWTNKMSNQTFVPLLVLPNLKSKEVKKISKKQAMTMIF